MKGYAALYSIEEVRAAVLETVVTEWMKMGLRMCERALQQSHPIVFSQPRAPVEAQGLS